MKTSALFSFLLIVLVLVPARGGGEVPDLQDRIPDEDKPKSSSPEETPPNDEVAPYVVAEETGDGGVFGEGHGFDTLPDDKESSFLLTQARSGLTLGFRNKSFRKKALSEQHEHGRKASRVSNIYNIWPLGKISFSLHATLDERGTGKLYDAIRQFHRETCLMFAPAEVAEDSNVEFSLDRDAYHVGEPGWSAFQKEVKLSTQEWRYGDTVAVALHEIGHLIGFAHTQSHPNRDYYVKYDLERHRRHVRANECLGKPPACIARALHQYRTLTAEQIADSPFTPPYDYDSIMHYPFTWPYFYYLDRDELAAKKVLYERANGAGSYEAPIGRPSIAYDGTGHKRKLSVTDIATINRAYDCAALQVKEPAPDEALIDTIQVTGMMPVPEVKRRAEAAADRKRKRHSTVFCGDTELTDASEEIWHDLAPCAHLTVNP